MEDYKLLALLQQNPDAGFAEFLSQYGALIKGVLRRILPTSPQDVEECAVDILVLVWKNAARLQETKTPLRPWLLISTRNLGISKLRKKARQNEQLYETTDIIPTIVNDITYIQKNSQEETLQHLVASMPQPDRSIFQRKYWLMQSSKEIAAALGLEVQTVNTRLFRGRKLLKQALEQEMNAEDFMPVTQKRGARNASTGTVKQNNSNKKLECTT